MSADIQVKTDTVVSTHTTRLIPADAPAVTPANTPANTPADTPADPPADTPADYIHVEEEDDSSPLAESSFTLLSTTTDANATATSDNTTDETHLQNHQVSLHYIYTIWVISQVLHYKPGAISI